ncbi:MAG: HI0074 family nucleotidyltransferase substrate-binding subunit [Thermoguttaceae bacterium]
MTPAGFQYHEAVQMALVQAFEIVLELGWKTVKDCLENDGYADIKTGREAIRQAHQIGLIDNGENWLTALDLRNLTSHTYDEQILTQINNFVAGTFINDANALLEKLKARN